MKRTISKRCKIYYVDYALNLLPKGTKDGAIMQLEIYHSVEAPKKNIGAFGPLTGKFTYSVGNTVNVEPEIIVDNYCMLTNVIRTDILNNYLYKQR